MLLVCRFDVPAADVPAFTERLRRALELLTAAPGCVGGEAGRAVDDPRRWVLTVRFASVDAYRRALSPFPVREHVVPLLSEALADEPPTYEVLADAVDGAVTQRRSLRAEPQVLRPWWQDGRPASVSARGPDGGTRTVTPQGVGRGFEVLDADECRRLLATRQIGRIALAGGQFPVVLPVNYALDGDTVVIRTDSASILAAAEHGRVAFEVDAIDERERSGWSVLVQALAEEVTDAHRADLVARIHATGVTPWVPGERGHWVRLLPKAVTGRRIVPGQLPPPFEPGGYL